MTITPDKLCLHCSLPGGFTNYFILKTYRTDSHRGKNYHEGCKAFADATAAHKTNMAQLNEELTELREEGLLPASETEKD